jgi:hypothetical protein
MQRISCVERLGHSLRRQRIGADLLIPSEWITTIASPNETRAHALVASVAALALVTPVIELPKPDGLRR